MLLNRQNVLHVFETIVTADFWQ